MRPSERRPGRLRAAFPARQHERRFFARCESGAQAGLLPQVEGQLEPAIYLTAGIAPNFELGPDFEHQKRNTVAPSAAPSRLARQQFAVGAHLVGLRVDLDPRLPVVVDHMPLAELARAFHRLERPRQAEGASAGSPRAACDTKVTEVRSARRTRRTSAVMHRLRRRIEALDRPSPRRRSCRS